jgi:hypothetical protein
LKKPHALIGLLAALGTAVGVLVAVFGLPYGRMNYTAFAGLYHVSGGVPAPGPHYALDCDTGTSGIQEQCNVLNTSGTLLIDVVYENNAGASSVGAFAFSVFNPDITKLDPPVNAGNNPDFNELGPGTLGTWNCTLIPPDNDEDSNPATTSSSLDCFTNPGPGPATAPLTGMVMGTVTYNVIPAQTGQVILTFARGVVGDNDGIELLNCLGTDGMPGPPGDDGQCFGTIIDLIDAPTNTPTNTATATNTATNTPTATPTPLGASVRKIPEGCDAAGNEVPPGNPNVDCSIPAANLFLCVSPNPCSGPGEGNLIVFEYASNVLTGDQNGDTVTDGLGAYEFSVEYDNFVIQSVNPSDVVFAPSGSVNPYPGGADGVLDGEGAARAPANCSFSLIFENVVHFGCVTAGAAPGPTGDMDIARLNLVPHPDLTNDIFPGNDNGVVTVLKDNGCELVDVFGHPVVGSVNGGLTPVCGDLAVTVRILEGDLNLDCVVDVEDQQLIGFRYGSFFGSLLYNQWYDLEPNLHDLDIDIKDLQKVFGRDGSTCQNPIPAQPPVGPPAPFGN